MGAFALITTIAGLAVPLLTHHLVNGYNNGRRPNHRAGRR
jgi:hypothetical protein